MGSITGVGERLQKVLGQIGSKLWFPWQQKAPIVLQWRKRCLHLFSVVFDPILFILAGNKDMHKISDESNLGQIGPLTTELWENAVSMLARSILIESSSKLLVTRTGIKLAQI